tara:strand:- start:9175 stop:9891 length:717 start_codon:yes stop_codon:yes gene_type:complete
MSFFKELEQIGVESVKNGTIGCNDHEKLKRKIHYEWTKYDGGRNKNKIKAAKRNFFFYWEFTLDQPYDRCMPTAEQVYEALPDELKFDKTDRRKVTVEAEVDRTPIKYTVAHWYSDDVNKHFEAKENENSEHAAMLVGPEHWGHVSLDTCERRIKETPGEKLCILENALACLGYDLKTITTSAELGAAWKRALENEVEKKASKAFKQALVDVVGQKKREHEEDNESDAKKAKVGDGEE